MSDPREEASGASPDAVGEEGAQEPAAGTAARRDADGLPLDRPPTLDDVRGEGSGRTIAVGCSVLVALLLIAFWAVRAGLLG